MPPLIDFITRIYDLELVRWEFLHKQQYSQDFLAMVDSWVDSTIDTALKLSSNKEMGGIGHLLLGQTSTCKKLSLC